MTQIIFNTIGLEFYADVTIVPEVPARITGNPDNWCEDEPMEFYINELYVMGENAKFLLQSDVDSEIEDAIELAILKLGSGKGDF